MLVNYIYIYTIIVFFCFAILDPSHLKTAKITSISRRLQEETASAPSPNDSFDVVMRKVDVCRREGLPSGYD